MVYWRCLNTQGFDSSVNKALSDAPPFSSILTNLYLNRAYPEGYPSQGGAIQDHLIISHQDFTENETGSKDSDGYGADVEARRGERQLCCSGKSSEHSKDHLANKVSHAEP